MKVGHFLGQPCFARGHQVSTLCAEQALNLFVRSVRPHTEIAIAYAQLYTMDEDKIPYNGQPRLQKETPPDDHIWELVYMFDFL